MHTKVHVRFAFSPRVHFHIHVVATAGIHTLFNRCMSTHAQVYLVSQSTGSLSSHILEVKRSRVFYWLVMRASEFQRGTFLKVFMSIHNSKTKMNPWNGLDWGNRIRDIFVSKQDAEDMYPIQVIPGDSDCGCTEIPPVDITLKHICGYWFDAAHTKAVACGQQ